VKHASILALLALLEACTTAPSTTARPVEVPETWLAVDGRRPLEREWWASFGDPVLVRLVDEALTRNLDLRQAAARVIEAQALVGAQRGASSPSLDAVAGASRARSISEVNGLPHLATGHQALFQASYEVDLWGKASAITAAAEASKEAARTTRDAIALSVVASVASGYISLRALDAQLELTRLTLISRERSLALTRSRQEHGYGSALESAQAEAELRATAQVVPQLELAIQRQQRALNLLLARPPSPVERGLALGSIRAMGVPSAGLPSELLRRRPDIASAEYLVVAADAQLAASQAQLLPSLRLTASLGTVGSSLLRGDPFTLWSAGGSVLAPIFNGGRLHALVDASASRRNQALMSYERTVLTSFAEVELQLTAFAKQHEQLMELEAQRRALEKALVTAGRRYREGYASYLDELLAQRNLFNVQQNELQLRADLLTTEIGVYRALGGGWQNDTATGGTDVLARMAVVNGPKP
jgi:outer membrane protein, multidrug efflux system